MSALVISVLALLSIPLVFSALVALLAFLEARAMTRRGVREFNECIDRLLVGRDDRRPVR